MKTLHAVEAIHCQASKKAEYAAPSIKMKSIVVEDGFGTSQFNNHRGMTEQMEVVYWN